MSMALAQSVATLRAMVEEQQGALRHMQAALNTHQAALEAAAAELTTLRATVAQLAVVRQAPRKEAASGQGT
jgi:Tfp pilus assembly protein FimV